MKIAFIVHNDYFSARLMEVLAAAGIDYYTRWDDVKGKGHGTQAHLGAGGMQGTNTALMIAFPDEAVLEKLIGLIKAANEEFTRPDDKIRLFQMPLERMV